MYRVLAQFSVLSQRERERREREREREHVYSDTTDFLSHCFVQQTAEEDQGGIYPQPFVI